MARKVAGGDTIHAVFARSEPFPEDWDGWLQLGCRTLLQYTDADQAIVEEHLRKAGRLAPYESLYTMQMREGKTRAIEAGTIVIDGVGTYLCQTPGFKPGPHNIAPATVIGRTADAAR